MAKSGKRLLLLFPLHCREALSVKIQKMAGVILGLRVGGALKARSRRAGFSIPRGDRDKLHQVERDVFVATRSCVDADSFLHKYRPPSRARSESIIAKPLFVVMSEDCVDESKGFGISAVRRFQLHSPV